MIDRLSELWVIQQRQQEKLGLDPSLLGDVERRKLHEDLVVHLHEEASAMARLSPSYKRHMLNMPPIQPIDVSEKCVDLLKLLVIMAQLYGLTSDDLYHEFLQKTRVIEHKAQAERVVLERDTLLFATDLDGVLCDINPWYAEIDKIKGDSSLGSEALGRVEEFKDGFYKTGGFGRLKPVPGAVEAMMAIHRSGYKIVIVTARPQWQYKRLHADTVSWLRSYAIPCDILLFNKDKCEALYEHVHPAWPVLFVEDHERNARALAQIGVKVLLFNGIMNTDFEMEGVTRVYKWSEVLSRLEIKE